MNLDVRNLIRKKILNQKVEMTLDASEIFKCYEDIKAEKPVTISGTVSMIGDILHLDIQVVTDLLLQCTRCVEYFTYHLELNVIEDFSTNESEEDDGVIFLEDDFINLTDVIESNIFLAQPIKKLCKESCRGLCQICGSNLNVSACNCQRLEVDPRLSKLKDLFFTD